MEQERSNNSPKLSECIQAQVRTSNSAQRAVGETHHLIRMLGSVTLDTGPLHPGLVLLREGKVAFLFSDTREGDATKAKGGKA